MTPEREKPSKADVKPKKLPTVDQLADAFRGSRNLYAALLQAQKDVKDVEKDATTEFPYKYDYVSAEAILQEARRVLLKNGLLALRPDWRLFKPDSSPDADCWLLSFSCEIRHPESGEVKTDEVIFPAIKSKGRPWDKAIAAALTSGWAYWLRDQLQIPRVDASMDNRDDSGFDPGKAKGAATEQARIQAETAADPMKDPPRWRGKNADGVVGVPKPRKANDPKPLPEADKSRAMARSGKTLGKVPDQYWALRDSAAHEGDPGRRLKLLDEMASHMPSHDAKTRRGDDGWEFYIPTDKAEVAEVSVGSMFKEHDLPESEIAF